MATITKKQTSIAVFTIAFATLMIVGTIASAASDVSAFGTRHHSGSSSGTHQSIIQNNEQTQSQTGVTTGTGSSITGNNNNAVSTQTNNAGNAAVTPK